MFQQNNEPKHWAKTTKEWPGEEKEDGTLCLAEAAKSVLRNGRRK